MELPPTVCNQCARSVTTLIQQNIQPELTCIYCEKADSQLLYLGRPCCEGCYKKLRTKKSPSKSGNDLISATSVGKSIASVSLTNSILSYRIARQEQTKLTKKIQQMIKDYKTVPSNEAYLIALKKKSRIYYIAQETQKMTWKAFLQKAEGKSPLLIASLMQDRLIGAYVKQDISVRKPRFQDPDCGLFMLFRQGKSFMTEYSTVEGNTVTLENKVLSFGDPSSFSIQFDSMKIQTQLVQSFDLVDLDNLFIIRL